MGDGDVVVSAPGTADRGSLVTGGVQLLGGLYQQHQQRKEAGKQREWSANMAGSAYQRAVIDMKAAGLNPALAYGQGGASTPSGAMAQVDDVVGPAVSSVLQAKRLSQELKLMKQQTAGQLQQNRLASASTDRERAMIKQIMQNTAESSARTTAQEVNTELQRLLVPGATNAANVERSRVGAAASYMDRIIGMLPRIGLRSDAGPRGGRNLSFGVN